MDVSECLEHAVYVYRSCSISSHLDWYSVFVNAGAEVTSSFPPSSGAVIVPSSQQQQQTPPQPSIPLLSSAPAPTTGRPCRVNTLNQCVQLETVNLTVAGWGMGWKQTCLFCSCAFLVGLRFGVASCLLEVSDIFGIYHNVNPPVYWMSEEETK